VDRLHHFFVAENLMNIESSKLSQIIEVAHVAWEALGPKLSAKMLWSDIPTKRRAQLTRFEPGATLPLHRHVGDELLYVIEGCISDEFSIVAAGSVGYRPDGCIHSVSSKNGATIFSIMSGEVAPAEEIGSARDRRRSC
jgi:anti-sigma factor ChrR (cupin superfamily)